MTESAEKTAVRAHMYVSGRVQGVGYRAFVARAAMCHGLFGGVKNLDDGRVEVEWSEGAERFSSFRIWY